ncbi:MAG: hypothetical protein ACON4O_00145 [Lentimonas sp.]
MDSAFAEPPNANAAAIATPVRLKNPLREVLVKVPLSIGFKGADKRPAKCLGNRFLTTNSKMKRTGLNLVGDVITVIQGRFKL